MSPNARITADGHRGIDVEARSRRPVWCLAATIGTLEARCRIMKDGPDLAELSLLGSDISAAHTIVERTRTGPELRLHVAFVLSATIYFQAKPSQAKPSQAKPSQAKPSQAKPSQAKPSQAKPNVGGVTNAFRIWCARCPARLGGHLRPGGRLRVATPHEHVIGSGAQLPEHLQGTEQTGATPGFVTPRTRRTATHMNYGCPVISPSLEPPLAVVSP
jgi:hypothetical protein